MIFLDLPSFWNLFPWNRTVYGLSLAAECLLVIVRKVLRSSNLLYSDPASSAGEPSL